MCVLIFYSFANKYFAQTELKRKRGTSVHARKGKLSEAIPYPVSALYIFLHRPRLSPSSILLGSEAGPVSYGLSLGITSSLGLAPPNMAELGLATWFNGAATVRGFSCSLGLCALSSSEGSLKSSGPPRGGPSL